MRKDKVRAYELRKQHKSYSQISALLNVPKSTLATWFKNHEWSKEIRDKLGKEQTLSFPKKLAAVIKANKARWAKTHQGYRDAGEKQFEILKDNPLFLAGVMLYWGEGTKDPKGSELKLANTEPLMIRFFYQFLKEVIHVPQDKIRIWLLLYPDLADDMQNRFWSRATGVPLSQFRGSIYIKGRHPTKRLSYGVCNIYVSSREFKEKMLVWLDLYQKMLIR
jgi:hypothetical protein